MTAELDPPKISLPSRTPEEVRLGDLVGIAGSGKPISEPRLVLLGFPSDEGVRINGGRPGAREGCDRLRHWLYRMTPDAHIFAKHCSLLEQTLDLGNLRISGDVAQDQEHLGGILSPWLEKGVMVIVLGGGHETTFGHFLGYANLKKRVALLNLDAHPDVRPLKQGKPHSGSPFRQALLHPSGCCALYSVMGLGPNSAAPDHTDFVRANGGRCVWEDELTVELFQQALVATAGDTLVSFDLDVVNQAYAPGVSAPNPSGIDPQFALHAAYLAGRSPNVASFDVVELNPRFDEDDRAARLAARVVWQFICGLVKRS